MAEIKETEETKHRKLGFSTVWLLTIITIIVVIGILVLGIIINTL